MLAYVDQRLDNEMDRRKVDFVTAEVCCSGLLLGNTVHAAPELGVCFRLGVNRLATYCDSLDDLDEAVAR